MSLRRLLDILVPRFVTDEMAVEKGYCGVCDEEHLQPVCCMDDIEPGEVFDGIVSMRCFNLFGFGLFARVVGDVKPWVNPWDGVSV